MKSQLRKRLLGFGLGACLCLGSSCGILGGKGSGGKNQTQPVTGLVATPGNAEIILNWSAYPGANGYGVLRSATSGGPFSYIDLNAVYEPPSTATSYTDAGLPNGTTYYYEVVADGSWGVSNPSSPASATAAGPSTSIAVTVDVSNQHPMSLYVYTTLFRQSWPRPSMPNPPPSILT